MTGYPSQGTVAIVRPYTHRPPGKLYDVIIFSPDVDDEQIWEWVASLKLRGRAWIASEEI